MEIKCKYQIYDLHQYSLSWPLEEYTCIVDSCVITEPNQEVAKFIGTHEEGKTDLDVKGIRFYGSQVNFMPRGFGKIFPNLQVVHFDYCQLREIRRDDLKGLEEIEMLSIMRNELELLPDDLFEGMKKLKRILFDTNEIEFASSQLFKPFPLYQLEYVNFLRNPTINAIFDDEDDDLNGIYVDFLGLMALIDEKCKKPPKTEIQGENETREESSLGDFGSASIQELKSVLPSAFSSDFTFVVGDRKFPANKDVLAMKSEFFAEVFKNNEENSIKELKIENLSVGTVEAVLNWIETGKTSEVKSPTEFFALITKLKISGLKDIAEGLVFQQLNEDNAMEIFELGNRYGSEKLKDLAFEEIKKFLHQPELNGSFKNKPEELKKLFEEMKMFKESIHESLKGFY